MKTSTIPAVFDDFIENERFKKSFETPMHVDALNLTNEEKIKRIASGFREIMMVLGLDLTDDSLANTPERIAKMFINETFAGLNPENKPSVTLFENNFKYKQMIVEKDITFYSTCEHHFVPIIGIAHVAYISSGKVIGLSKLNRLVNYYAKRPQVQERLTIQIAEELKSTLATADVAVIIKADHLCVQSRGIRDTKSSTITSHYCGKFNDEMTRSELFNYIS